MHAAPLVAHETLLFEFGGAQRHEPKQHVVGIAPEPHALRQSRAEAAAARAAVTFVAARQAELLDEIRVVLRQLGVVRIGTMQSARDKGLGIGLPGARRLMDEFAISSAVGTGTIVTMKKWVA